MTEEKNKIEEKGQDKTVKQTEKAKEISNNVQPQSPALVKPASQVNKARNSAPFSRPPRFGAGRKGFGNRREETDEFEQRIVDIARVTRVMAGGKRMRFRACVAVGNKKGKIAVGLAKGADVTLAVTKAVNMAKKNIIDVPIVNDTIPHEVFTKLGAAKILLKPASKGWGVIAGGVVRIVLELAGVKNISSKILGSRNKVNNARCTIAALSSLKKTENKKTEDKKINQDKK